jgi:hypothetical protein
VPAVIGFARSQELIELATSTFLPNDVLAMSAINMSSLITTIPHPAGSPRLVWRTMYTTTETALPTATLVEQVLEPKLRAGALGKTSPLRVAVVTASNATGLALSDALVSSLTYNGKPALSNGANFLHLLFPEDRGARFDTLSAALRGFRPHVVVYEGGDDFIRGVVEPLEASWPSSEKIRPFYIANANLTPRAFAFIGADAERRHRFFGVVPRSSTSANAEFVLHYNETFADPVTITANPNSTYDAFYVIAYAAFAATLDDDRAPTGSALARAIARLVPPGAKLDVGKAHIFDVLARLRSGENVDLGGAVGKLDFDLRTGDAPTETAILCAGVDDEGRAADSVESGLVFDTNTKRLEGVLRCK